SLPNSSTTPSPRRQFPGLVCREVRDSDPHPPLPFPSVGTTPSPLPASEKLGKGDRVSVVSLVCGCQNLHDARPVARRSQCAVAHQFFRNLRFWGDDRV